MIVFFLCFVISVVQAQGGAACDGERQTCGACVDSTELGGGCSWCTSTSSCAGPFDAGAPCSGGSWVRTCGTPPLKCWQYSSRNLNEKVSADCPSGGVCGASVRECNTADCTAFEFGTYYSVFGCFLPADCGGAVSYCCYSDNCNTMTPTLAGTTTRSSIFTTAGPGPTTAPKATTAALVTTARPTTTTTGPSTTARCAPGFILSDSGQCVEAKFSCVECKADSVCDESRCSRSTVNGVRYCAKGYATEKDGMCKAIADSGDCCTTPTTLTTTTTATTQTTTAVSAAGAIGTPVSALLAVSLLLVA